MAMEYSDLIPPALEPSRRAPMQKIVLLPDDTFPVNCKDDATAFLLLPGFTSEKHEESMVHPSSMSIMQVGSPRAENTEVLPAVREMGTLVREMGTLPEGCLIATDGSAGQVESSLLATDESAGQGADHMSSNLSAVLAASEMNSMSLEDQFGLRHFDSPGCQTMTSLLHGEWPEEVQALRSITTQAERIPTMVSPSLCQITSPPSSPSSSIDQNWLFQTENKSSACHENIDWVSATNCFVVLSPQDEMGRISTHDCSLQPDIWHDPVRHHVMHGNSSLLVTMPRSQSSDALGQLKEDTMPRSQSSHALGQLKEDASRFPLDIQAARLFDPEPTSQHLPGLPSRSSIAPIRRVVSAGDLQVLEHARHEMFEPKIGHYTVEERKLRVDRYRQKRNQRNFTKKIKYVCRKTLADNRPRIKGRFAPTIDGPE